MRQHTVFKAREIFEAWADEQHERTMQQIGWSPEEEVAQHLGHLDALILTRE